MRGRAALTDEETEITQPAGLNGWMDAARARIRQVDGGWAAAVIRAVRWYEPGCAGYGLGASAVIIEYVETVRHFWATSCSKRCWRM